MNSNSPPLYHHCNLSKFGSGLPYRRMWDCLADMYPVVLMSYDLIHITLMPRERKPIILDWLFKRGSPSRSTIETLVRPCQYRRKREIPFRTSDLYPGPWLVMMLVTYTSYSFGGGGQCGE